MIYLHNKHAEIRYEGLEQGCFIYAGGGASGDKTVLPKTDPCEKNYFADCWILASKVLLFLNNLNVDSVETDEAGVSEFRWNSTEFLLLFLHLDWSKFL